MIAPSTNHDTARPVQLEVSYQSADALVTAYTASLSKGGFVFMSEKPLMVGTRFDFRMKVENDPNPVTLLGLVVRSKPQGERHQVAVQYLPTEAGRGALGRLLGQIQAKLPPPQVREEPRIPVNLIARDAMLVTRTFVIENLSHGGMGISLARGSELPSNFGQGASIGLEVKLHDGAAVILRGEVAWVDRGVRNPGVRFGVKFAALSESEHLVVGGMMQLFRPHGLLLAIGEECMALLSKTPSQQAVNFDPEAMIELVCSELLRFLSGLTERQCVVTRRVQPIDDTPTVVPSLKLSADLAGDVDMEMTLFAERSSLELLARGAGFQEAGLEAVHDSGLELLSTLAGHVADQMERLNLREEVLPHVMGQPLSSRRPFDRRIMFEIRLGAESMLLEVLLRLQTLLPNEIPEVAC